MLSAEIIVNEDAQNIEKLFSAEEREFDNKRASYEIKHENSSVVFKISAKDSSALRAALNSITKLLIVYEKSKNAIKGADNEQ